ncbi:cupin domain-containing protein [Altericroceibacterium spongiae]|uniref:Cupin domain-containing protein n=1 Tax=Altericroceibacterium spongiae TaxID=2320269 RepID=A0A420ERK4_9SPHN|nr:cupin domain-containing protein [Altericroceibacterium spongiae]RKF23318.1 cupin domain-containing protein [Altericroceibacterium spongiae]
MKQWIFAILVGSLATAGQAQDVVHSDTVEPIPGPEEVFTGRAEILPLTSPTAPGQAGVAVVTFQPGARSNWHTHPAGQTLYVTKGCGWVQEEGQPVQRICAGDAVYAKPGIRHWHGATDKEVMSHLAITETLNGKNVEWMEPVSDDQYSGPEQ